MSGYASMQEVREVIAGTLTMEGRAPADYSITAIAREAFYDRGAGYGYGALGETAWREAVAANRKRRAR